jgi:uncharacterized protein YecE (DUF72 family)
MVTVRTGTSGFSYKEWKGTFYPADLPDKQMLAYYATRLGAVEINNTFYRMPTRELVSGWAAQVPDTFRFSVKAPQRITHRERLVGSEATVSTLLGVLGAMGERLGVVLFQLPPFQKKDVPLLQAFLPLLPPTLRVAFEFRHPSWFSDDAYEALSARNVALVGGDADHAEKSPPLVPTADFGYLRLRAEDYSEAALVEWESRIQAQSWREALVFLKHEVRGPEFAERLSRLGASRPGPGA